MMATTGAQYQLSYEERNRPPSLSGSPPYKAEEDSSPPRLGGVLGWYAILVKL